MDRILIIRPSALGDVCRTVPVLASLDRAFPDAAIDWVVQDSFRAAIAAHPALHEAIAFPRARFARWWRSPAMAAELLGWLGSLRRRRYDLAIDCQGLWRSGLMCLASAAPTRVGLRSARELGWLGYTVRHRPAPGLHTVDEMLSLLEPLGVTPVRDMRLYVDATDSAWWARQRAAIGIGSAAYAVLAPTTRWPSKRWPIDHWRRLIEPLRRRGLDRFVLVGSPGEESQVAGIAAADPATVDLTGTTTVGQTMAVIAGADLVIANDSAPLHMAVGLERPCVGLYGPTDPELVGPYGRAASVVRPASDNGAAPRSFKARGLGDRLMRLIEVEQVLAVVDRALQPGAAAAAAPVAEPVGSPRGTSRRAPTEQAPS